MTTTPQTQAFDPRFAAAHYQDGRDLRGTHPAPDARPAPTAADGGSEAFGTYIERSDGTSEFRRAGEPHTPTALAYHAWTLRATPPAADDGRPRLSLVPATEYQGHPHPPFAQLEYAALQAALDLTAATGSHCFSLPVPHTTPALYLSLAEQAFGRTEAAADAAPAASEPAGAVQVLREALTEIADDYADRFDLESPSTNPGIKHCVEQARAALSSTAGATVMGAGSEPTRPTVCTGHVPCGDDSREWCRVCPKHDRAGGAQP